MKSNLTRLKDNNTDADIIEKSLYLINDEVYVSKEVLAKSLGVSGRHILNLEKEGLEVSGYSLPKLKLYHLNNCKIWYQKKHAPSIEELYDGENPYTDLPDYQVPKEELERRHEYEKLKKAKRQNDILEEKYIEFDEVDKLMATLSVMLLSSLKNHEKSAPAELENKSASEILERLKIAHVDIANRLHELANKEFDCDETLYDVIYVALSKMYDKNITTETVCNAIKAL